MLIETITNDWKQAMRNKDEVAKTTLSILRANVLNIEKEKKTTLDDAGIIQLIQKEIKKRQDSIIAYTEGNRLELADKEKDEIEILNAYLPQQLTDDEVKSIVNMVALNLGQITPLTMKDMGRMMKAVNEKTAGKADNKLVSELVRAAIS